MTLCLHHQSHRVLVECQTNGRTLPSPLSACFAKAVRSIISRSNSEYMYIVKAQDMGGHNASTMNPRLDQVYIFHFQCLFIVQTTSKKLLSLHMLKKKTTLVFDTSNLPRFDYYTFMLATCYYGRDLMYFPGLEVTSLFDCKYLVA